MSKLKTPDITPAQIVALAGSAIALLSAFGLPLSEEQSQAILDFVQVVAPVLLASDAVIRFGRSMMAAKRVSDEDLGIGLSEKG